MFDSTLVDEPTLKFHSLLSGRIFLVGKGPGETEMPIIENIEENKTFKS